MKKQPALGLMRLAWALLGFPAVTTAALVGYWTFEEGAGTTTADQSGNGLSGTFDNVATWGGPAWTNSPLGAYCLRFDGVNDRVNLGNPTSLQLTGAMTLSAWVNVRGFSTSGRLVTKGGSSGSRGWSLNVENTSGPGKSGAFQVPSSSTALISVTTTTSLASNQWVHLCGVFEPGVAVRIYTNGFLNNTVATAVTALYNNSLAATIGARPTGAPDTPFNGLIDNVRIYNTALSEAEIRALPELAQTPITFLIEPVSQTVQAPLPVTFQAAIQGSPPYFIRWFSNGVAIAGADMLSLTLPATTTNLNGATFSITVSNLAYTAASSNAVLTISGVIPPGPTGLLSAGPQSPITFRTYEIALGAQAPGALPHRDGPEVTASFHHASGTNLTARGFWDGSHIWRIRFAPTLPGEWTWSTASPDTGLDGLASNFVAVAPTAAAVASNALLRGFLVRDGAAWRLSDGSLFLPVGDTQFSFSEELFLPEFQAWMDVLMARHLNTVQGCAWLSIYTRGGLSPFNGTPSTEDLNPAYFRRLDQMVQSANDRGIMVGLVIGGFPDNSQWWRQFNTQDRDDRWFRYVVARYSAFNVRWILYGEVDEANPAWGTWQAEVLHKAQLIKADDPYRHPVATHHRSADLTSINNASIDYLEVQLAARNETQYTNALNYRQYGKPLWFEEFWYESAAYDNEYTLGIRNTHRSFIAALAFPTFGSLMRAHAEHADFPPTRAAQMGMSVQNYLLAQDPGLQRMQYFADFMRGLNTGAFSPAGARVNRGQCGRFGNAFAIFLQGGGNVNLDLTDVNGRFDVRCLDINTGQISSLGNVTGGGVRTIISGTTADVSILVVPAAPRLEGAQVTPQNEFAFRLIGEDQRSFGIERTGDFLTWSEVGRITTTNAQAEFREALSDDGSARRFYRAVAVPITR